MRGIYLTALFLITLGLMFIIGCGQKPAAQRTEDKQIVAQINKYELTVSDFKDEAGSTLERKRGAADPLQVKKEFLDDLIMKKILIQEAQRENFDKEKSFMEEIERYWEQALLKLLMKKKIEELSRNMGIDEKEVVDEYNRIVKEQGPQAGSYEKMASDIKDELRNRKIQKALEDWIVSLRNKANVKINEEVLKKIDLK